MRPQVLDLLIRSLPFWALFSFTWIPVSALKAQDYWIAGDTSGLFITRWEKEFVPNASVSIDMDCDGLEDILLISSKGAGIGNPWDRLSLRLAKGVELHNGGEGKITPFQNGDTIRMDANDWTAFLDFIYGTGKVGSYGHPVLEDVFLVFRKKGSSTVRCLIRFSSQGILFTIHEIQLECPGDPVLEVIDPSAPLIFPNPCYDVLYIRPGPWQMLEVFDTSGRYLKSAAWVDTLQISDLAPGMYLLRGVDENGKVHLWKFIKA